MKQDIEISRECDMLPVEKIAGNAGLKKDELELYGPYKAKITDAAFARLKDVENGKLILVTAINPTPAGEGKTTVTVGLGQALCRLGKNAVIALREPSLGPVFGLKGGAAGGGYAQVVPMEDINLHFTGDLHAITSAHNLLSALLDNHIQQGNQLGLDTRKITWKRALDMNDRALRNIVVGLGAPSDGVPRQDGFDITVASEIMAILCLAEDIPDLKKRLGRIIVGYNFDGQPVTAKQLGAVGAMTVLLKDAVKPNLVQTLENTPCLIHGGPFANIAHGCNSVRATKLALKLGDYCVTEAGFGADLGGEKFLDIKCRTAGLVPSAVVLVATVRALKYNGYVKKEELGKENPAALAAGLENLGKHIENLSRTGIPLVVALNRFSTDTPEELLLVHEYCDKLNIPCADCEVYAQGGAGGENLARQVILAAENKLQAYEPFYPLDISIKEKIHRIVVGVYGGSNVSYTAAAEKMIERLEKMGYGDLPVCMAKTQYSLSDNPSLLGRPRDFEVTVKEVRLSAGAGFIVVLTGTIMTMPGLPKSPAANAIDMDASGVIKGLF